MEAITENTQVSFAEDWKLEPIKGKETYSVNEVINAYLQGKKAQADADKQLVMDKLNENLSKAQEIAVRLFGYVIDSGFDCKKLFLRIKDIYRYSLLVVVNEDDFCNDEFIKVYEHSIEIKKEVNVSNTFDLTIIFTPESNHLSNSCLLSDGYNFTYAKED